MFLSGSYPIQQSSQRASRAVARIEVASRERAVRQRELDVGAKPDFLSETRSVRESPWTVAALPPDLLDRRVEIRLMEPGRDASPPIPGQSPFVSL